MKQRLNRKVLYSTNNKLRYNRIWATLNEHEYRIENLTHDTINKQLYVEKR